MNFLYKEVKMVGIVHPCLMFPGLHQQDGAHYPGTLLTELYRSFFFNLSIGLEVLLLALR